MKTSQKIARLELSTLFYSPIAWFLLIVFLFQSGLTYLGNIQKSVLNQELGGEYLKYLGLLTNATFGFPFGMFMNMLSKLYLYLPLLTMGLISREMSSGTIKLLYSSPIKISEIVIGKFMAMMAFCLVLVGILAIFGVTGIFNIQSADAGLIASGLLGIYLLLCAYSAIGLFMSSLTSYQVVAAISTLVVFALLNYIGTIWQGVDFVRDLTYFLSISGRTEQMIKGLISTKDVLYFILIVYIFLAFTVCKLQSGRETKSWLFTTGRYAAIFFSALLIGYVSSLPGFVGYYDATANKSQTLSANTQKILKDIGDEPLEVTSYINLLEERYRLGMPAERIHDFTRRWEKYIRFKPNIKLKYVYYYDSTSADQHLFENYPGKNLQQIAQSYANTFGVNIHDFKSPEEIRKIIDLHQERNRYVMQLAFKGKKTFLRLFDDAGQFPSETETAAALKRLTVKLPKIAFLEGELERSKDKLGDRDYGYLASEISYRFALVNQGFDVETISLEKGNIPPDIAVLVIADPKINFSGEALAKIQDYLNKGGNLLLAGEPGKQAIVNPLLQSLGVQIMDGTLVQKSNDFSASLVKPYLTSTAAALSKDLTNAFRDSTPIAMNGVAGLTYNPNGAYIIKPLLITDATTTWNKKGRLVVDSAAVTFSAKDGDQKGSVPTALALTRKINGKEQRIIITGDADFLSTAEMSRGGVANYLFGTPLLGWFTYGQFPIDTSLPETNDNRLTITNDGVVTMRVIYLGLLPGLLLIAGSIFLIRRKRK